MQLDDILELIPLKPKDSFLMSGIGHTYVIRFRTFYLKFEDVRDEYDTYRVRGYQYNSPAPLFVDDVKARDMQSYCRHFDRDDGLATFLRRKMH